MKKYTITLYIAHVLNYTKMCMYMKMKRNAPIDTYWLDFVKYYYDKI